MKVRVVLFAKPRELVGQPNIDLALPAGATAADAWSQLSTRYDLGPLPRSFRCAVNSEYAGWDDPLKDGDELAVIPPVSGGAIGERRGLVALREEPLDPMAIGAGIRSDADGALACKLISGVPMAALPKPDRVIKGSPGSMPAVTRCMPRSASFNASRGISLRPIKL